jgi:hypothetical protein
MIINTIFLLQLQAFLRLVYQNYLSWLFTDAWVCKDTPLLIWGVGNE